MYDTNWIPDDVSLDRPNAARMYDYMLGGFHNFEADRMACEKVLEIYPDSRPVTHAHRALLRRVVRFLSDQGIDQFLDIGSGIPTVGNVHEMAQKANPDAHVVYVDIDPVAVAHSKAILKGNPNAAAIRADAGQPEKILNHPKVKSTLDFSRPMGVLFLGVLHFLAEDEDAHHAVRTIRDAVAPGSYIAISHGTHDDAPPHVVEQITALYSDSVSSNKVRPRAQTLQFFEGLELIEPGLVHCPAWRPEGPEDLFLNHPERVLAWGGVGRKP
jgi:hypothetical protein